MNFIDEFCHKYQAEARPSSRPFRRAMPVPYSVFQEQGMTAFDQRTYQDITMVEITMPEDRFRALLEHDHWLANAGLHDNGNFTNNVMRVANMVVEHERECRIRQENPAVQKAWEQYQIMLGLYGKD